MQTERIDLAVDRIYESIALVRMVKAEINHVSGLGDCTETLAIAERLLNEALQTLS